MRPLKSLPYRRFERTIEGAAQFVAWLEEKAVGRDEHGGLLARAVMEATSSFSEELARWLRQLRPELAPAIVNPRHTRAFIESLAQRNKTDAVDARALARYGFERRPEPYEVLSKSQQELRELVRLREDLVDQRLRSPSTGKALIQKICYIDNISLDFLFRNQKYFSTAPLSPKLVRNLLRA